MGGKDLLNLIFSCLTNYHYIERRLQCSRVEVYHLLQDFMLVSDPLDKPKREILAKVYEAIEYNVLVLSESPHLLQSCLRGIFNVPNPPSPWLE